MAKGRTETIVLYFEDGKFPDEIMDSHLNGTKLFGGGLVVALATGDKLAELDKLEDKLYKINKMLAR